MKSFLVFVSIFLVDVGAVNACPEYGYTSNCTRRRPTLEWSSSLRLGYQEDSSFSAGLQTGLGVDGTVGLTRIGDLRAGSWARIDVRNASHAGVAGGLQLQLGRLFFHQPNFGWVFYEGVGVLRAGLGRGLTASPTRDVDHVEVELGYGYRSSWHLRSVIFDCEPWNECNQKSTRPKTRYMIGGRLFVNYKRALDNDWSAVTVGLEIEPVGTLRFLAWMLFDHKIWLAG